MSTDLVALKEGNLPMRQDFSGSTAMELRNETAASSVAAQAKAMVESRYVMALRQPRDWDQVRSDLLKECRRPSFANNKSAFYRKPIGQGVEGLGIRFVEVALRCMKNVLIETKMIYEDEMKEVHNVSVTDLESNLTYPMDVKVSKTVERSKPADDGSFLAMRKNSYGKAVYTLPANDDDLLNKRAALISKAMRTLGLRIIPGDLQDEAEDIIKEIRKNEAARDPDAERKRMVDAFAEMNISATQLKEYLGHELSQCTPAELVNLRGLYGALRDGEATWASVMENKREQDDAKRKEDTKKPTKPASVESLRSGKVDTQTGEIKTAAQTQDATDDAALAQGMERKPEQQQSTQADDNAPTLEDAIAFIKQGELDMAREIGAKLGKRDVIDGMIANREKQAQAAPAAEEGQQQERPRGRGR